MKPIVEHCGECGAKKVIYPHLLSPGIVSALRKAAQYSVENRKRHFRKRWVDPLLTKSESSNWSKLRFHGMVAKIKDESGGIKRGWWVVTHRAWEFLAARLSVPQYTFTYRNRVVQGYIPPTGKVPYITIREVKDVEPYFEQFEDIVPLPPQQETLL